MEQCHHWSIVWHVLNDNKYKRIDQIDLLYNSFKLFFQRYMQRPMPSTTTPITSSSTTSTTGIATAAADTLSPTNTGLKRAVEVAAIHINNRHVYYCQKATPGKLHTWTGSLKNSSSSGKHIRNCITGRKVKKTPLISNFHRTHAMDTLSTASRLYAAQIHQHCNVNAYCYAGGSPQVYFPMHMHIHALSFLM